MRQNMVALVHYNMYLCYNIGIHNKERGNKEWPNPQCRQDVS
jgi:hypothetical protein